jgi:hypothetical protein
VGQSVDAAARDGAGQLKVAGASHTERQARKLSLLLEVSQKLSGELDLDKLLGRVVGTTFDVMNVDRVSVHLSTETGDLVPRVSKSRLGDASAQLVPRRRSLQGRPVHHASERPERDVHSPDGGPGTGAGHPLRR